MESLIKNFVNKASVYKALYMHDTWTAWEEEKVPGKRKKWGWVGGGGGGGAGKKASAGSQHEQHIT